MPSCIEVEIVHLHIPVYTQPNSFRWLMKQGIIVSCRCKSWRHEVCIVLSLFSRVIVLPCSGFFFQLPIVAVSVSYGDRAASAGGRAFLCMCKKASAHKLMIEISFVPIVLYFYEA